MESWYLLPSQELESHLMAFFWVLSKVVGLLRRLKSYTLLGQETRHSGCLANHWLRLYHSHKVWCEGADKGLIEYSKIYEWFTDYFTSELVIVCKGRGTPCEVNLNWVPNHFIYFYIIDKLHFYFLISFWYLHFFLLLMNPLVCNWELLPPLLLVCHSKYLFCPFQWSAL